MCCTLPSAKLVLLKELRNDFICSTVIFEKTLLLFFSIATLLDISFHTLSGMFDISLDGDTFRVTHYCKSCWDTRL